MSLKVSFNFLLERVKLKLMMSEVRRRLRILASFSSIILCVASLIILSRPTAVAAANFAVSPMNQSISLVPGETYSGSFKISNLSSSNQFEYRLEVTPFWASNFCGESLSSSKIDNNYCIIYESRAGYNLIANWIKFNELVGKLQPSETRTINFTINVPETAPIGGQYVAIKIIEQTNANNFAAVQIGHLIYAELNSDQEQAKRSAVLKEAALPSFVNTSFLFKPNSSANAESSTGFIARSNVQNTGNTMGTVQATFEAYPLFSNELKFSNFDSVSAYKILPETSRLVSVSWTDSPRFGLYKVLYKVYLNAELVDTVDRFVLFLPLDLICLILILLIIFIIVLIIFKKGRKRASIQSTSIVEA